MFDKLKGLMELKSKAEEIKKKLDAESVEERSSDGLVSVKLNGSMDVLDVKILKSISGVSPETLEKSVKDAFTRAITSARNAAAKQMLSGGLPF